MLVHLLPLFVRSPLQNFHAAWGASFTLLRTTDSKYEKQLKKVLHKIHNFKSSQLQKQLNDVINRN